MSGLISPLTAVGEKNPAVEVCGKDLVKCFVYHRGPELEFSAWASLSLGFPPNADVLCRYLTFALRKGVEVKFCPAAGGAGRLREKGRNCTRHH